MAQLNGRPATVEELQALALTNYGHFTSFRIEAGRVRGLDLHLDRLARDCRDLFAAELDIDLVRHLIRQGAPDGEIATARVTIFDPAIDLGHPASAKEPHILVTQRKAASLPLPPLNIQSFEYAREAPEIKSVGLFASLRLRRQAQLDGYDDALFVNEQGFVSEGGTWNIGFFDGTDVVWPDAPHLPGVTMRLLREAHPSRSSPVKLTDVASMTAAFATNAAIGVRAITKVDGISLPSDHEIINRLRAEYLAIPATVI